MNTKYLLGMLAGIITLAMASAAHGTDVTLRVEGKTDTLIPAAKVTLPSAPFKKDGTHDCAPDGMAGALQASVGDDWNAVYGSLGYFLSTVRGYSPSGDDYFTTWINNKSTYAGVCDSTLQEGDSVLIYVDYCSFDPATFMCTNDPVLPLGLELPARATPGSPFTVTVTRYAADGTPAPVAGAMVSGGAAPVQTGADGKAAVTLAAGGPASLRATKANFARVDTATCATTGSDGFCGTTKPGEPIAQASAGCVTDGADGRCGTTDRHAAFGRIGSVIEGQRFKAGGGPRTLSGSVEEDPSGVRDVRLRLTRNNRGRCAAYDAKHERFVKTRRCGAEQGVYFSVGDRADWSYLLPSKLSRGRYVLDIQTTDGADNTEATLARGRSRIVFFVG